jgi:osmotically-inducible protein OsmY
MDDKTLRDKVIDELDWDPKIDPAAVAVSVNDGIVQLSGHVASYYERYAAEAAVKRVKDVHGFVDHLVVRAAADPESDETIAGRVVNILDWQVSLPKGAVQAKVENGLVTLTGEVNWQYQRAAAEGGTRSVRGVRGLSNQIQVKPRIMASDVKRKIEDALDRQADIEAKRISVTIEGDKVRLDGKVRAWFERDIVENAAWAAPGVRNVETHLMVGA